MATEFKLPEVGEGITSGTVVGVLVSVGDTIAKDQAVLELETDKAVVEVPSSVSGVVQEILVKENEEASVGQVVLIVGEGESEGAGAEKGAADAQAQDTQTQETQAPSEEGRPSAGAADAAAEEDVAQEVAEERAEGDAEAKAAGIDAAAKAADAEGAQRAPDAYDTPLEEKEPLPAAPSVRRLARELGVNLRDVKGSGILGRISAEDVRRVAAGGAQPSAQPASPPAAPAPAAQPLPDFSKYGSVRREPMSGIRKATVRSMTNAWSSVPMVTHFDKADTAAFEAFRQRYKARAEAAGAKLTPTAVLLKMAALALKKFPKFNASLDLATNEVVYKDYLNVGVAVDTEYGLLVPVIRDVDKKGVVQLAKELGEIAEKARARKLGPEDMQGGNFSISNLGGIGGTGFTPIVNPPEVAILGVARGTVEPVWDAEAGEFKPRTMMPLSLSYDHRLIDGADAARFLRFLCETIEDPYLMAVEG
ncbi:2-oxo acid dehydrogenase subunit E2 [Truepera radiovictrix]|uniref:Dihydrolipoamide acetyltransferase component of pyruvate dehydrogenase complex n=1 Tax=Truepera radiovictrix (strain DSM 17093 / CIP 108686 / LMG 22925 / RQ-24) TaxID=649638 RepID=D7CRX2_TRURR|nr:2-oxo acid dehydrogenase subunit E2 [Truepera radiovictrix]ADI15300.1 catalytic domain of components of various dehydrogenase complexes [Truepera radiovictrix DSM 17093]WMT56150.1 2-oxo acid dehydrogenase subunit E2 [Truepera radiovictrix]